MTKNERHNCFREAGDYRSEIIAFDVDNNAYTTRRAS